MDINKKNKESSNIVLELDTRYPNNYYDYGIYYDKGDIIINYKDIAQEEKDEKHKEGPAFRYQEKKKYDTINIYNQNRKYEYDRGYLLRSFLNNNGNQTYLIFYPKDKINNSYSEKKIYSIIKDQNIKIDDKSIRYLKWFDNFIVHKDKSKNSIYEYNDLMPIILKNYNYQYILKNKLINFDIDFISDDTNNILNDNTKMEVENKVRKGILTYIDPNIITRINSLDSLFKNYGEYVSNIIDNAKLIYLKVFGDWNIDNNKLNGIGLSNYSIAITEENIIDKTSVLYKNKSDNLSYIKRYNFIKLGYFNQKDKNYLNYGYKLDSTTTFYNNIFNCSIHLQYIPKDKIIPNINKYELNFSNNINKESMSLYKEDNIKYQLLFRECLYNKNFDLLDLLFKSVHININLDIEYDLNNQDKDNLKNTDYRDKIKECYNTLFNDLLIKIKEFSKVKEESSINNLTSNENNTIFNNIDYKIRKYGYLYPLKNVIEYKDNKLLKYLLDNDICSFNFQHPLFISMISLLNDTYGKNGSLVDENIYKDSSLIILMNYFKQKMNEKDIEDDNMYINEIKISIIKFIKYYIKEIITSDIENKEFSEEKMNNKYDYINKIISLFINDKDIVKNNIDIIKYLLFGILDHFSKENKLNDELFSIYTSLINYIFKNYQEYKDVLYELDDNGYSIFKIILLQSNLYYVEKMIQYLIDNYNIDINFKDKFNNTILHYFIDNVKNNIYINDLSKLDKTIESKKILSSIINMTIFLKKNNINIIKNKKGEYPLIKSNDKIDDILIKEQLDEIKDNLNDLDIQDINIKDDNNNTILHLAIFNKNIDQIEFIFNKYKDTNDISILLNYKNNDGNTPLHLALEHLIFIKNNDFINIIKKLITNENIKLLNNITYENQILNTSSINAITPSLLNNNGINIIKTTGYTPLDIYIIKNFINKDYILDLDILSILLNTDINNIQDFIDYIKNNKEYTNNLDSIIFYINELNKENKIKNKLNEENNEESEENNNEEENNEESEEDNEQDNEEDNEQEGREEEDREEEDREEGEREQEDEEKEKEDEEEDIEEEDIEERGKSEKNVIKILTYNIFWKTMLCSNMKSENRKNVVKYLKKKEFNDYDFISLQEASGIFKKIGEGRSYNNIEEINEEEIIKNCKTKEVKDLKLKLSENFDYVYSKPDGLDEIITFYNKNLYKGGDNLAVFEGNFEESGDSRAYQGLIFKRERIMYINVHTSSNIENKESRTLLNYENKKLKREIEKGFNYLKLDINKFKIIIVGDFNRNIDNIKFNLDINGDQIIELKNIEDYKYRNQNTFHNFEYYFEGENLDHLLTNNKLIIKNRIVDKITNASDHYPVKFKVEIIENIGNIEKEKNKKKIKDINYKKENIIYL